MDPPPIQVPGGRGARDPGTADPLMPQMKYNLSRLRQAQARASIRFWCSAHMGTYGLSVHEEHVWFDAISLSESLNIVDPLRDCLGQVLYLPVCIHVRADSTQPLCEGVSPSVAADKTLGMAAR